MAQLCPDARRGHGVRRGRGRLTNAIRYHHAPDEERDVVCDVVYVANQVAKRIDDGYMATPEEMSVDPAAQERLKLSPNGLDAMCAQVSDRLDEAIAQYEIT